MTLTPAQRRVLEYARDRDGIAVIPRFLLVSDVLDSVTKGWLTAAGYAFVLTDSGRAALAQEERTPPRVTQAETD